jgi:hypothetical protein
MKFVDSLVSRAVVVHGQSEFLEARVAVSAKEYALIERVFQQILDTQGNLNEGQKEQFREVKKMLPRFRQDWRYKDMEKEAKDSLLDTALRLNPGGFEDLFKPLKYFLRRSTLQRLFDQVYIALYYNKDLATPHKVDFVTRFYLERMAVVFVLLKPYLTKKQVEKWEQNLAKKLKRF